MNDAQGMQRARTPTPDLTWVIHQAESEQTRHATVHQVPHPTALRKVPRTNHIGNQGRQQGSSDRVVFLQLHFLVLVRRECNQHATCAQQGQCSAAHGHVQWALHGFSLIIVHGLLQIVHVVCSIRIQAESFVSRSIRSHRLFVRLAEALMWIKSFLIRFQFFYFHMEFQHDIGTNIASLKKGTSGGVYVIKKPRF